MRNALMTSGAVLMVLTVTTGAYAGERLGEPELRTPLRASDLPPIAEPGPSGAVRVERRQPGVDDETATNPEWLLAETASSPPRTHSHAMAYDSARGRVVLFAAGETWEWNGAEWTKRMPVSSPGYRFQHDMAYDSARGRVVLFGGQTFFSNPLQDTWEWDGDNWVQRTPVMSPPARYWHAMAYDSARGRVVLFGGGYYSGGSFHFHNDTWEWDGDTWIRRPPGPPARIRHAMAYDSARGCVVLFGGYGPSVSSADTWEWDGWSWVNRTPATSPAYRFDHAMAYDSRRGHVVLFGGNVSDQNPRLFDDTWEWDGSGWVKATPATNPPAAAGHGMAYDSARSRVVLFPTRDPSAPNLETWEWDGSSWSDRTLAASPPFRSGHAMAYDTSRGRVVLFGGAGNHNLLDDTWERDGNGWVQRRPATSPPARHEHAMAYDRVRRRVVLFGGEGRTDTWEWDGSAWVEKTPATSPPAYARLMVYDSARRRVVLFDGAEMWEWNGTSWLEKTSATPPPAYAQLMAYDEARRRVVVFDGADMWEWDGRNWVKKTPATTPPAGSPNTTAMVYDPSRGRVVLFMAVQFDWPSYVAGTWEWDGDDWVESASATQPPGRRWPAMVYDGSRRRVVLFGGLVTTWGTNTPSNETWEYGEATGCSRAASATEFTPGPGTDATSATAALGTPDGQTVSLGLGGAVVLKMESAMASGSGTDFIVYAKGVHDGGIDENLRVEASNDRVNWVFVRDCPGGVCHLDLAHTDLTYARYVRITDLEPQEDGTGYPDAGADIDAVVAVRCAEECAITPTAPPDGASYGWRSPAPTFTWESTCELSYQVEFANSLDFEHPGLLVFPGHPTEEASYTPNHGQWTAIGYRARTLGGTGAVYWRVVGYDEEGEEYRGAARSMTIEWQPRR